MLKKYTLYLCILFLPICTLAQSGDYYLRHFAPNLPRIDNDNYGITQDGNGQMKIANRQGLLSFDGSSWIITHTPSTVLSVKYDASSNTNYVGCMNDFGYISVDKTGKETFVSLAKGDLDARNIAKIEVLDNFVYFLGESVLYEYSKKDKTVIQKWKDRIMNIFSYNNSIFVCFDNYTIQRIGISKFNKYSFGGKPESDIVFCTKINATSYLVGTSDNKLYNLSGNYFREIKLKDEKYIENCELFDAVIVDENTAVIATTKGGCLIVNLKTGDTKSIINFYSGLPDNEIYAIGIDAAFGVWIAHEYGLTRVDYHVPFKCFSNYLGLEGRIEAATTFKNQIYVATNEGVYVLSESKLYKEIKIEQPKAPLLLPSRKLVTKKKIVKKPIPKKAPTTALVEEPVKKERFSFRNIFKRKKDETVEQAKKEEIKKIESKKASQIKSKERKTARSNFFKKLVRTITPAQHASQQYVLESVKHNYKQIGGIKAKCLQLITFHNRLLAATNSGIYEINGLTSTQLCDDNIKYLYVSKYSSRIYASTTEGNVISFQHDSSGWKKLILFNLIKQPISYIAEDNKKNLWLSGLDKVYKISMDDSSGIDNVEEIDINNPYSDEIFLTNINQKLYFALSSTFYYFDYDKYKLVKDVEIEKKFNTSERIVSSQSDVLWIFNHKKWEYLSDVITANPNFIYLSIFRNIDEIMTDPEKKIFWVITEDNKLYSFDLKRIYNLLNKPKILVKDIKGIDGYSLSINNFTVQQDNSNLVMNVITPDYYDQEAIEYQHKIVGLQNDWSEWSKSNSILLNYLTSGKYKLLIRSRNSVGQITERDAVSFTVKPPYWQTWWFYMIEMLFFSGLWLLSFRLNRMSYSNVVIRRILTFITLVMTIEFMSTVAESIVNVNVSPVIDFIVKVVIAIILFPFEQFLVKFIAKKDQ